MKNKKLLRLTAVLLSAACMGVCAFSGCDSDGTGGDSDNDKIEKPDDPDDPDDPDKPSPDKPDPENPDKPDPDNPNPDKPDPDEPDEPVIPQPVAGQVKIIADKTGGDLETSYVCWEPLANAVSYNVYVAGADGSYKKLDGELVREYSDYFRADAVGLKEGTYKMKVVPVDYQGVEQNSNGAEATNITVKKHVREGFAFVGGTSSGAYNEDGTLKSDAVVLYVTNANKDTVTVDGVTVENSDKEKVPAVGLQQILDGWKGQSRPLDVRLVGQVYSPKNTANNDPHTVLIKEPSKNSPKGVTFEGIGSDTSCYGWTLRVTSSTNVEVRNLAFLNSSASEPDGITLEKNNHVWVHNCDFYYLGKGSDADQVKGDGALDTKQSTYVTHSFNHFWDSGKCNLQNMHESGDWRITYHHNWYDHSDSRHPRIRSATVHVYNNYFDGNAKYGVGSTEGSSVFVENNYFRSTANMKPMLISKQGSDKPTSDSPKGTFSGETGGMIKSFGNVFDCPTGKLKYIPYQTDSAEFDCYEATTRGETVPNTVQSKEGGNAYNNFDTAADMYTYAVQSPADARDDVVKYAGRVGGGDIKFTFNNAVEDANYGLIPELKNLVEKYSCKILKINGVEVGSGTGGGTAGGEDVPAQPITGDAIIYCVAGDDSLKTYGVTLTGNAKSGVTVTYNGKTFAPLKMESAAAVSFTLDGSYEMKLYAVDDSGAAVSGKKIKVNATNYTTGSDGYATVATVTGSVEIKKGDSCNLAYVILTKKS